MQGLKAFVLKSAPAPVASYARVIYKRWVAYSVSKYDRARFKQESFVSIRRATKPQLEAKMNFHAHSVEKGLSHSQIRMNFGRAAVGSLVEAMAAYRRFGYDPVHGAYQNGLSTLKAYWDEHVAAGTQPALFSELVPPWLLSEVHESESGLGGARELGDANWVGLAEFDFADFFESRSSVREFAEDKVPIDRVRSAIQLAMKSPSVCNRQPCRVKIIQDAALVERLLVLQGGMTGYKSPPLLLVVTSDVSAFLDPTERNQPFVDGGLFSLGLLLSLHHERLAACPLNTMMTVKREKEILRLLGATESERLIMFIAAGEFKPGVKVPKSFRYSAGEITNEI